MFNVSGWKAWEVAMFGGLGAAAIAVGVMILSAPEGDEDWAVFKEKNHCVSVAAERGANGGGWRCDDGKIHYRWRQQK